MKGNFSFYNPVKLYFGDHAQDSLGEELRHYGPVVMLSYGGGSIRRNGIYDQIVSILKAAGKTIVEDPGVMPNPTIEKLMEGARKAREQAVDLILAVGGGSTIDYAKGVSVSAWCEDDPWETFYVNMKDPAPDARIIPVGSVLTMVGTGSEMNAGSVITNHQQNLKIGKVFDDRVLPKFAILNPKYTFTVPHYQMVAGFFDIMSHIMEQYFSGEDDNTSDYLAEGLMRSLVHASLIAAGNPHDYEARSNIMWTATWALNSLIGLGKSQDWEVHMIGHAVSAVTGATHGMTLAAVSLPYYRLIMSYGLQKFVRFARSVWKIPVHGRSDEVVAQEGLQALSDWMKQIGVVMHLKDLGVKEDLLDRIADGVFLLDSGYKKLSREEVLQILRESL